VVCQPSSLGGIAAKRGEPSPLKTLITLRILATLTPSGETRKTKKPLCTISWRLIIQRKLSFSKNRRRILSVLWRKLKSRKRLNSK
jgi:hypothetical protein